MAQKYTPIWDDWLKVTRELTPAEKGRLIDAIVAYDNGGDWQEIISGNERYVFPGYQVRLDLWKELSETRAKSAKGNKSEQTYTNNSKTEQNQTKDSNSSKVKVKDKVKDKDIKSANALSANAQEVARRFDKFWSVYPRHEGKQAAQKAFDKIKPDDTLLETMINTIVRQKQTEQWSDPRYIPHPATWLNGRRWEDEPVKPGGGKRVLAQQYEQREYKEQEMSQILGVHSLFEEDSA